MHLEALAAGFWAWGDSEGLRKGVMGLGNLKGSETGVTRDLQGFQISK